MGKELLKYEENKKCIIWEKTKLWLIFSENICAVYIGGSIAGRDRDLSVGIYI